MEDQKRRCIWCGEDDPARFARRGKRCASCKAKSRSPAGCSARQAYAQIERQGGMCAICTLPMPSPQSDHDHATGLFRGMLCRSCNVILGKEKDSPDRLRARAKELRRQADVASAAVDYLLNPPAQKTESKV